MEAKVTAMKLVFESYVFRNSDNTIVSRLDSREAAEEWRKKSTAFVARHGETADYSPVEAQRAEVECEVVRYRYPINSRFWEVAGKTVYRVCYGTQLIKELNRMPSAMDVIKTHGADFSHLDWKTVTND